MTQLQDPRFNHSPTFEGFDVADWRESVTRMETGPIVEGGDWGYLIKGKYVSAKDDGVYQDSNFFKELCALNPHKRDAEGGE